MLCSFVCFTYDLKITLLSRPTVFLQILTIYYSVRTLRRKLSRVGLRKTKEYKDDEILAALKVS